MHLSIVTGGSRGLGLALCELLVARGNRVIEFSRTAPHAFSERIDLSSPIESQRIVERTIAPLQTAMLESLLVVNNAGSLDPIGPGSMKAPEAMAANLDVNLVSPILCLGRIVATFQSARCPKIIANISSGAALKGYAGWSLYCAAKSGMENFVRSLAAEQRHQAHPFMAINIEPGVIDTEMQGTIRAASTADFPDVDRFIRLKAEGRLASPADVAKRILRIVSSPSLAQGGRYDVADADRP